MRRLDAVQTQVSLLHFWTIGSKPPRLFFILKQATETGIEVTVQTRCRMLGPLMLRNLRLCLSVLLLASIAVLLIMNGCGDPPPRIPRGTFEHIVIIFQENRTPDNLFHDPVLMAAGADIASTAHNSLGETIPLTPVPLGVIYDPDHSHASFVKMYDGGKMDGADNIPVQCPPRHPGCAPPNPQFHFVDPADIQPYFQLAEQYTFADRMFQTNQGPSFPAHQFIISGTSAPTSNSTLFMAENTMGGDNPFSQAGCIAPPQEFVYLINAKGDESQKIYPCTDHPTLTDELNANNISWRYYTPTPGVIWTAPNAIEHMCGPNLPPPNATKCVGSDWTQHVVLRTGGRPAPFLTDIANHQLPSVSWVIPSGQESDHAGISTLGEGPSWVAAIVNAIGNSSYWANTAIIITWDDWGGWYDHVAPAIVNDGKSWGSGYVYGFRVPLIVVSPFAKPAYISHNGHHFGSILNLIEENFGLRNLGYADAHADDLFDCFNLKQAPLKFKTIPAPLDAEYFLDDTRPPAPPDND